VIGVDALDREQQARALLKEIRKRLPVWEC